MMSFATHLECSLCQKQYPVQRLINLCSCGSPLLVRYDLRSVQRELDHVEFARRPATMWRYLELLLYAARGGLEAHILMPLDNPPANRLECEVTGAEVSLINGLITECGKLSKRWRHWVGSIREGRVWSVCRLPAVPL